MIAIICVFYSYYSNGLDNEQRTLPIASHAESSIQINVGKDEKPIKISEANIDSRIYGNLAQTDITLNFYNPNNRPIAADFIFPIPENSIINGYSLDVNGKMIDGVIVEKDKGRITFEKITRQNIDPGLVEKVQGNLFKTRIFPIAANSNRAIRLSYFTVISDNDKPFYQIPAMGKVNIEELSVKLQAYDMDKAPLVRSSGLDSAKFVEWKSGYLAEFSKSNVSLSQPINIQLATTNFSKSIIGKNNRNEYFFTINPTVDLNDINSKKTKISNIQLIWDASHSRLDTNLELELALLNVLFNQHKNVNIELYILRNDLKFENKFTIKKGNWQQLKNALSAVQYDGATNLSELKKITPSKNLDMVLLFSDAIHTFTELPQITVSAPLNIINSNFITDANYAEYLANNNQGSFYSLKSASQIESIINSLSQPIPQLLSIDILNGELKQIPALPMTISQDMLISGQLMSKNASLILNYGIGKTIFKRETIELEQAGSYDTKLPELVMAQRQINRLSQQKEKNKDSIIKLSKGYGLVSDFTSLIVLENLEQYVEHRISPPKSLPNMAEQYQERVRDLTKETQLKHENKIEQIITLWSQRKKWWSKKFPVKSPLFKQKNRSLQQAPQDSAMEHEERVIVTGSRIRAEDLGDFVATNEKEASATPSSASIKIAAWDPKKPYITTLKQFDKKLRLKHYYQLKAAHLESPAFYFDVANFFFAQGEQSIGLQILSNIAELKIQDARMLRTMAAKLLEQGFIKIAVDSYRNVLQQRPEEPQSYRDLALALEQLAAIDNTNNIALNEEAIKLLYKVVTYTWDRFQGMEVTALMELNKLLLHARELGINYKFIDKRLIDLLDVDIRIVLSWDTDMTDIDLWVIEPSGEKVTYDHKLSTVGGMFHQDFTGGYGPEEYLLKKAPNGDFTIKVHFYGNPSPEISGATTLYVNVFTNYGRSNQEKQTLSLRLEKADDEYLVGTINFSD